MDRGRIEPEELRAGWRCDGWVHLPGFFQDDDVAAINAVIDALWIEKPARVTVDDVVGGGRCRMSRLADGDRSKCMKIRDLYLISSRVRSVLLDRRLCDVVAELLGEEPVLCQSLNLERGTALDYHSDSLFMPPLTRGKLATCWIALEDVLPGAGPLRLCPASHLIPRHVFSDDSLQARNEELARLGAYLQKEIDAGAFLPKVVYARKGDLVIWHADLLHGAEPIVNSALTRKSMVGNYFGLADCLRGGYRIAGTDHARWQRRRAQPTGFLTRLLSAFESRVQSIRRSARRWASS